MSLKQVIQRSKQFNPAVWNDFTMKEEPLIYSIKYKIGKRQRDLQYFRNQMYYSILRCNFQKFYSTKQPVVLLVKFYVKPPLKAKVSAKDLKQENVPAVFGYELCDYLLSLQEHFHHVLLNSYKQIVKIDAEKYYSNNPRTVFKLMKWEDYVKFQNHSALYTESERKCPPREVRSLQSECTGDDHNQGVCAETVAERSVPAPTNWALAGDMSFQNTGAVKPAYKKTRSAKLPTSREEARRGQSGKVSQ